MKKNIHLSVDM